MKSSEYRKKLHESGDRELTQMLKEERQALYNARQRMSMKQQENPREIRERRKNIARILTVAHERELKAAKD